jgi:hypothetical protein
MGVLLAQCDVCGRLIDHDNENYTIGLYEELICINCYSEEQPKKPNFADIEQLFSEKQSIVIAKIKELQDNGVYEEVKDE